MKTFGIRKENEKYKYISPNETDNVKHWTEGSTTQNSIFASR